MANILFAGFLYDNAGDPITTGVTAELFARNDTDGTPTETAVGTNADGYWALTESTAGRYDVKITSGSSVRYIKYDTSAQMTALEVLNLRIRTADFQASYDIVPADIASDYSLTLPLLTANSTLIATDTPIADATDIEFGAGSDAVIRWATGDSSNHALFIGVGATNGAMHIGNAGDIAVDWNLSAEADPQVFIHSDTTPATDYLRLGNHDGTTAEIDVVGGTTLRFMIAGATEATITSAGLNLPASSDLNFTGTTGTNDIVLTNGLADALSITDGSADVLVIDTSTSGNVATWTAAVAASSLTADDVAIDGKVITMTGSTDDTAVFTVATNGALTIQTTDTAAAAANLQITADGTVDIDSAGVLTLDSGAAINIEPASGSAILLDGTISIDAGVVTGASSITSTAFVGTLSTAAQANVTSLGSLTGLRLVDDGAIAFGTTNGTDWDMYHDGSDMYMQKNTGGLMIALSGTPPVPDRDAVHIWNGTSGSGDPPSDRADLIIEDNSHVGIALLCPNTDTGFIYFADEDDIDIGQIAYDHDTERMQLRAGNTTGLLITGVGNIQIGDNSVRGTTVGTNTLEIFNGTEPAGTLSNGCSLYSKGGEMFVMAADGGTGSQISPHDRDGYWIFNGGSGKTRKRMKVKMELLMRRLNDEFGGGYIEDCEGED